MSISGSSSQFAVCSVANIYGTIGIQSLEELYVLFRLFECCGAHKTDNFHVLFIDSDLPHPYLTHTSPLPHPDLTLTSPLTHTIRINSLDISTLPHPYLALTGPLPNQSTSQSSTQSNTKSITELTSQSITQPTAQSTQSTTQPDT